MDQERHAIETETADTGNAEHRLRTPLTSIRTCAEILLTYPVETPEAKTRFLEIIQEEAVRLTGVVDELFSASAAVETSGAETAAPPSQPVERPVALVAAPVPKPTQHSTARVPSPVVVHPSQELQTEKGGKSMSQPVKNKGWSVVLAGTGINLALGVLYSWSIFKGAISNSIETGGAFRWDLASVNDPYAVCCLAFAFAMIFAGRCQDRWGPRVTALVGGLLVGAGFLWVSQTTSYLAWILGFGVMAGTGLGFGYGASTPPALKWFPPAKTGLIAGIVVSGFGLASVYIAPLAKYMLAEWGLQQSMLFFGIAFAIVVTALSTFLVNPPEGHLFGAVAKKTSKDLKKAPSIKVQGDFKPTEMLKTVNFYTLWALYFIGAGAGLMVIGSVAGMAKAGLGEMAFVAVAMMAVGNASGRIVAGVLSDKIGRVYTLLMMLVFQAALMFGAIPVMGSAAPSVMVLVLLATFIGFNYGTNLSLFPSFTKDMWGLKNFGANYGILFSAWGVGGFVMGRLSQMLKASTGSYDLPFITAGVLLIVGAGLTLTLREGKDHQMEAAIEEDRTDRPAEERKVQVAGQG